MIRQHPDSSGNVISPLSSVYEQGSFTSALIELAFTAELSRSAPSIVTQVRKVSWLSALMSTVTMSRFNVLDRVSLARQPEKGSDLTAGALFFDRFASFPSRCAVHT